MLFIIIIIITICLLLLLCFVKAHTLPKIVKHVQGTNQQLTDPLKLLNMVESKIGQWRLFHYQPVQADFFCEFRGTTPHYLEKILLEKLDNKFRLILRK